MANATIDALYAGSLRLKISYFFLINCTFYKWCVTKVAHCIISVEVYCAYKETSPLECTSSDCSGETALLSRLIWAFACNLCIGYQYIHALCTFMYYMYIC